MNFYLDFEATQFSERIISIGCVNDIGESFKTLVKPVNGAKVNEFITKLTGITNEMLENAPTADQAFNSFFDWVINVSDGTMPQYFCYGHSDVHFIEKTAKYMTDVRAISFAMSIKAMLIDYAKEVRLYFSSNDISLKKLVALVRHVDDVEQVHDAMDDALMLKECFENIGVVDKKAVVKAQTKNKQIVHHEEGDLAPVAVKGFKRTSEQKAQLKELRCSWIGIKAKDLQGDADETDYAVKLIHKNNNCVKYFTSVSSAAVYFNHAVKKGRSASKESDINKTIKEMCMNPNGYCGYRCEINYEKGMK